MKLLTSRAKAKDYLEERIAKIAPMYAKVEADGANFYDEFQIFKNELEKWRSYNRDLLKRIYADAKIAQDYYEVSNGAFLLGGQDDFDQFNQGYKPEIASEISFLESCIDKLGLYDEPKEAGQAFEVGGTFDGFRAATTIVRSAQKSIFVVDAYVDDRTLDILSAKIAGVAVRLLTKQKCMTGLFKTASRTFNAQHGPLEIRSFEKIHDRFMDVDSSLLYQFGGSLKDLGKQVSTILPVSDPDISDSTRKILEKYWQAATPEPF